MICRDRFEVEYGHLFDKYHYGSTIWSPLAGGILTGKYNDGNFPDGSRATLEGQVGNRMKEWFNPEKKDKTVAKLTGLAEIAKELGCSQASLALAWAISNKDVSTCIFGASKTS